MRSLTPARRTRLTLRGLIGFVWLLNGLLCKVLDLVPRHREIVGTILGESYAREITLAIGVGEIALAFWIWSGHCPRATAILQIVLVAAMNVLEFFLSPDLLLWGRFNAVFAGLFVGLVFFHGFVMTERPK